MHCVSSPHWELYLFFLFLFIYFFSAGTAFVPESSIISENISSGLRRATHSVCAGGRQCGGMWVSSVSMRLTVCRSPNLGGGGDRRRDEEANPTPHIPTPLILRHRQIRFRGKIEGFCTHLISMCTCLYMCVCPCVCHCASLYFCSACKVVINLSAGKGGARAARWLRINMKCVY